MGCIPWTYLKKKKNLRKEKGRKCLDKNQGTSRNTSSEDKDLQTPSSTLDADSITVEVKTEVPTVSEDPCTPEAKTSPPAKRKSVDKLMGAEASALIANAKRLEARVKRKEEAIEAKRLRKLKAAKDQADGATPDSTALPDQDGTQTNMKDLAKRCKASRRIQRIAEVLHLNDEMAEGLETALSPFFRF